jgi:hypothetical protein
VSWLYSQALVEAFSGGICSDGGPYAQLSLMPMQRPYSWHGRTMAPWPRSLSGTTCALLTDEHGAAVLTSYLEASPVRTLASQEAGQESTATSRGSGERWRASSTRLDPPSRSSKTLQPLPVEGSGSSSTTFPRSGTMRSGMWWERPTLAHLIAGSASGYSRAFIPTPTAGDAKSSGSRQAQGSQAHPGISLTDYVRQDGGRGRMYPTPTADAATERTSKYAQGGTSLSLAVRMYPTPTCNDAKNNGGQGQMSRNTQQLNVVAGGALNPEWVEWLMGWPLGWTDCAASATDKFHSWQRQHSAHSQREEDGYE